MSAQSPLTFFKSAIPRLRRTRFVSQPHPIPHGLATAHRVSRLHECLVEHSLATSPSAARRHLLKKCRCHRVGPPACPVAEGSTVTVSVACSGSGGWLFRLQSEGGGGVVGHSILEPMPLSFLVDFLLCLPPPRRSHFIPFPADGGLLLAVPIGTQGGAIPGSPAAGGGCIRGGSSLRATGKRPGSRCRCGVSCSGCESVGTAAAVEHGSAASSRCDALALRARVLRKRAIHGSGIGGSAGSASTASRGCAAPPGVIIRRTPAKI